MSSKCIRPPRAETRAEALRKPAVAEGNFRGRFCSEIILRAIVGRFRLNLNFAQTAHDGVNFIAQKLDVLAVIIGNRQGKAGFGVVDDHIAVFDRIIDDELQFLAGKFQELAVAILHAGDFVMPDEHPLIGRLDLSEIVSLVHRCILPFV